ncbi:hypothetical protein COY71_03210, partial [Candidatus Micrarchaeota archaeon CG_4_10_14_0_8_um_filter_60_7]
MIIALVFAAACLAFGFAATLAFKLEAIERAAVGIAAGVLAGGWLCLLLSWFAFGALGTASMLATALIL